ncbi:GspE/PulE family protein [Zhengella mangrovi]|nr:GspE/PulE family protein [Zhengella mangrovi]
MGPANTLQHFLHSLVERDLLDLDTAEKLAGSEKPETEVRYVHLKRLVETGTISAPDLARFLGEQFGLPVETDITPASFRPEPDALAGTFMLENRLVAGHKLPLAPEADPENPPFTLLTSNPFGTAAIRSAIKAIGRQTIVALAPLDDLDILLEAQRYGPSDSAASAAESARRNRPALEMLLDLASGTPVVAIVNELLEQAIDLRATDIHLEPNGEGLGVRYRVDGVLRKMPDRPAEFANAIVSRIKVLAKLDIAEKRKPQDGAVRLDIHRSDIDLRISTLPTSDGESVVIRLLDRSARLSTLDRMGMSPDDLARVRQLLDHPYGMIAVTGPTGSGKTTTLATALSQLNDVGKKIVTIEDPIEYRLKNVVQAQVHPEIGLTFAAAIRSFLRQDPDIIMVGEIRDTETAKAAVQASQTGHLLLTTLHANTAVSGLTRLQDLGVENYMIASNLRGIIAQRLVRVLCPACKKEQAISAADLAGDARYRVFGFVEGERVFRAHGCSRCAGTGYKGRTPVFEVFMITDEIAQAIGNRASQLDLRDLAMAAGMTTIPQDARRRCAEGITSPEEIFRVAAYL